MQIKVLFLNVSMETSTVEYPIKILPIVLPKCFNIYTHHAKHMIDTHAFPRNMETIYLIFSFEVQNLTFCIFKRIDLQCKLKEYLARKFLLPDYEI
jgi:membrane-bound acyltransferase YfiQ involved in biofilm formation